MSRWAAARLTPACAASATSSRSPASLSAARNACGSLAPANDHLQREEDGPHDDGRVGDVERRPAVEPDEVDDGPIEAQPVDEVADGAAQDDAERRPVPRLG